MTSNPAAFNTMTTILVATDLTEQGLNILRAADDAVVQIIPPNLTALRDKIKDAHALISRDDVPVDKDLLANAPHLRLIGRVGASLSGIDLDAATKRGVIVMNTPGTNAIAAGEHTFTLMLALNRKLVSAHNSLKQGFWLLDRKRQAGTQLSGKTLGLIGLGRVGQVVAQRALAFDMQVLAYDPYVVEDQLMDERIQLVNLRELLSKADIVSLHVPATGETRGMFNADVIRQMKPGARLINTSHGSIVDENALAEAIKEGRIAGAGIDVYAEEPPYNSPLIGDDRVIHTPHIGDNTVEAAQDLSIQIASQVLDALSGEDYRNVVNLPFVPGIDFEDARPYMMMAERMGILMHTLARAPIRRLAVEYRGDDMSGLIRPLTVALLKGLLSPALGESINYINAPVIAAERGIHITQAKGLRAHEYTSLVTCQATLDDSEQIIMSGTLLDRREPHIVQINDYRMNFVPEGHLLIMGSYDQPGVIGRVGMLMATNGVNIASWQTGRVTPGGQTLTVLELDEPLPDAILAQLRQQEFVRHAHQVNLSP
ncbi:MAG: phosphoglycerate dehydrogenase [Anaerolineae bacterium]